MGQRPVTRGLPRSPPARTTASIASGAHTRPADNPESNWVSSAQPSGPGKASGLTATGHPRAIFQRAIERQNLVVAEVTAREMGRVTLEEALWLTALVALRDPRRRSRFAVRWLARFLAECDATIEEVSLAASALSTFGGPGHDDAGIALVAMVRRASGRRRRQPS